MSGPAIKKPRPDSGRRDRCETCRFCQAIDGPAGSAVKVATSNQFLQRSKIIRRAECRNEPPRVLDKPRPDPDRRDGSGDAICSAWPEVDLLEDPPPWCGRWIELRPGSGERICQACRRPFLRREGVYLCQPCLDRDDLSGL